MSLYKFFESYVEETPELMLFNREKPLCFCHLKEYLKEKQKRSQIQCYVDVLMNDSLNNHSKNLQEYEILRLKSMRFARATQQLYESVNH